MCLALEHTTKEYIPKYVNNIIQNNLNEKNRLNHIIKECDLKTIDLLHEIELNNIKGMYHAWLIIIELKKVREIRRKAKDVLEVWRVADNFKKAPEKMQYKNVMNVIRKRIYELKHRYYYPKAKGKI
ncbi:hypothetical protein HBE96_23100 [Clostridium sp. P21]|uniref:Uncharacterized protein n=1 Tax=Clostridium muellerianum TaxID=2716538 RepID=A0A7Y0EL40_9CLOT|nr:hypothetical protein [Clostridium muellerianum]NMM65469.1 hypothetical protein [Clostridium muellerianum]